MQKGKVVVISGPSGCGKGTVIKRLLQMDDTFKLSVSLTTRKPRPGEVHGVDYYFVSEEAFLERIANDDLIEYTNYNGNYYGTPKTEIAEVQSQGFTILLDIEIEGAENFRKAAPENLMTIFLAPPSFEVLKQRLLERGTETLDVIERRLDRARVEMLEAHKYDFIVTNDILDKTVEEIYGLIKNN